jgi:hypothetical protein
LKLLKNIGIACLVAASGLMLFTFYKINTVGQVTYVEPNTIIAFSEFCLAAFGFGFALSLFAKHWKTRGE